MPSPGSCETLRPLRTSNPHFRYYILKKKKTKTATTKKVNNLCWVLKWIWTGLLLFAAEKVLTKIEAKVLLYLSSSPVHVWLHILCLWHRPPPPATSTFRYRGSPICESLLIPYDQGRPPGLHTSEPLASKISVGSMATQCLWEYLQVFRIFERHFA